MQAGVQLVMSMGYSMTVSTVQLLMKTLYQHLITGDYLSVAIRYARKELNNHKTRRAYHGQQIDLEDWMMPVVYQNQPVRLEVRELEAQQLLLCLAPFTLVIDTFTLDNYTTHLRQQPALSALSFERWPEVIREARNWGLLSPDPALLSAHAPACTGAGKGAACH